MTPTFPIRKLVTHREEIRHEFGPKPDRMLVVAWAAAVVANPYAGGYVADLEAGMEALKPMGDEMADALRQCLGCPPEAVEAYGKGSLVGMDGELEHGALWHVPGGYAMRRLLGSAKAIVPSSKKMGVPGTQLDVPLHHINAAYVRSHFSTVTVFVPDAPRAKELMFVIAMADGGRIHARMGGLTQEQISVGDGQR
ncbi:MAG: amino acid synthesis family protein [Alphaproteobacteria bacterium]|nr:amino acid synthesis family protein [Alphaproteobacteria bacterium]